MTKQLCQPPSRCALGGPFWIRHSEGLRAAATVSSQELSEPRWPARDRKALRSQIRRCSQDSSGTPSVLKLAPAPMLQYYASFARSFSSHPAQALVCTAFASFGSLVVILLRKAMTSAFAPVRPHASDAQQEPTLEPVCVLGAVMRGANCREGSHAQMLSMYNFHVT